MTSTVVYAIYHPDSGLFYDGIGLSELNAKTKFYNSEKNAKLANVNNFVMIKVTWDYLEKEKGVDRWHINVGNAEYNSVFEMMRQLKVVPVNLEHNQNVY